MAVSSDQRRGVLVPLAPEQRIVEMNKRMSALSLCPATCRVARVALHTVGAPRPERKVTPSATFLLLCTRGGVRGPRDLDRVLLLPWLLLPCWLLLSLFGGRLFSLGPFSGRLDWRGACWLGPEGAAARSVSRSTSTCWAASVFSGLTGKRLRELGPTCPAG